MPRTSLSALEILLRQTRVDPELNEHEVVRRNLMSMIRSYQRQGLDQGEQDIAVGRVLDRRHLLLLVPSGALKTPEAMNLVVRVQEQITKGNSALRRVQRRAVPMYGVRRRQVPTRSRREADEVDDDSGDQAAAGGSDGELR